MPTPALITDLDPVAGNNFPAGSNFPSELDDVQRAHAAFIAQLRDGQTLDKADLANKTDAAKGSALVGHSGNLNYAVGTIGAALNGVAINVRLFPYLAAGDGITDDTSAILAADARARALGGHVYFPKPPVSYRLESFIEFQNNTNWQGESGSSIFLSPTMTVGASIGGVARAIYSTGKTNIRLNNLDFYSLKTGLTKSITICLHATTVIKVTACTFRDFGNATYYAQGLIVFGGSDVLIKDNVFDNCSGDGCAFSNGTTNYRVDSNTFTDNGDWGFALVIDCNIGQVVNNIILRNTSTGTGVDRCKQVVFSGNIIDTNEHGIRVTDFAGTIGLSKDITVFGNVIANSVVAGISMEAMGASPTSTVFGNTVKNTTGQGIRVVSSEVGVVAGNTITGSSNEAILFQANSAGSTTGGASVTGNTIDGCSHGIRQLAGLGATTGITVGSNNIINASVIATLLDALSTLTGSPAVISWTPSLRIGASASGITTSYTLGWYVKEGKLITGYFEFTLSSKGINTGNVTVAGLPIAAASAGVGGFPSVVVSCVSGGSAMPALTASYISGVVVGLASQGATGQVFLTDANLTNTTRLIGSFSYITA